MDSYKQFKNWQFNSDARKMQNLNVLFIGDSITEMWKLAGLASWNKYFEPLGSFEMGIGGDTTQGVLWRLENGAIDGIKPKIVVVLIGSNDLPYRTPDNTEKDILAIIQSIHSRLPDAKILLLAILPREFDPKAPLRLKINQTNAQLVKLKFSYLRYLDISSIFLQPDGSILPATLPDAVHPTAIVYEEMAKVIEPVVRLMLAI
jgi:lysophospholipase L1-like esterase